MQKKRRKGKALAVIALSLLIPLLLTGCWNNMDLTELNIVAGLGLDRTEDGKIQLTVQIVEPGAIQAASSGYGQGGGGQQKSVFIASQEGETVFEAARNILSTIDKKLFFSTAQVLILGERLSQEGIIETLDFFERDHEVDYLMDVLVSKGATPKQILEMETDVDAIQAMYIKGTIDNTSFRGTVKQTKLIELVKDLDCCGKQPVIGRISMEGDKAVKTEGSAVFKNGKLAGWLDPYETRGYLFAVNEIKSALVNIATDSEKAAMEIIRSSGDVSVAFDGGEPSSLTVKVKIKANVGAYEGSSQLDSPDSLRMLEKSLAEEVEKEITMALKTAQKKYASDIFGFGAYVHKYHPDYWKSVEKDWDEVFSDLPTDVHVEAKVMRTGIIKNPLKKDE